MRHGWIALVCIVIASLSCKQASLNTSEVASLTQEELELCSFSGQRFLGVFAPDFQSDVGPIQNTFAQFFPSKLVEPAYMEQKFANQPEKLAACRRNLLNLGKYQQVFSFGGSSATKEALESGLAAMNRAILAARAANPSAEIQVMLAFTSHGSKNAIEPGGQLVLAGNKLQNFSEVAETIYNTIIQGTDQTTSAPIKLANEVVILMDNCFSGNFIQSIEAFSNRKRIDPNSTRVIALSSANYGQTSPGQMTPTRDVGVLAQTLSLAISDWIADTNSDGFLSWMEWHEYSKNLSQINSIGGVISEQARIAASLVCGPLNFRELAVSSISTNYNKIYAKLFAKPVETLSAGFDYQAQGGQSILTPRFYSNVPANALTKLHFAITVPGNHRAPQDVKNYANQLSALRHDKELTVNLIKVTQLSYELVNSDRKKFLGNTASTPDNNQNGSPPADNSGASGATEPGSKAKISITGTTKPVGGGGQTGPTIELSDLKLDAAKYRTIFDLIKSSCANLITATGSNSSFDSSDNAAGGTNQYGNGQSYPGAGTNSNQGFGNGSTGGSSGSPGNGDGANSGGAAASGGFGLQTNPNHSNGAQPMGDPI